MNSTRNVLVLAGHIVLIGLMLIAFFDGHISLEQLVVGIVALEFPNLFTIKRPLPPEQLRAAETTDRPGRDAGRGPSGLASAVFIFVVSCGGPASSPATATAEAVAEGGCKILEAVTSNAIVKTVCVNADELADAVAIIASRRDKPTPAAPTHARPPCKAVPTTNICATNDELLEAIDSILEKRKHAAREQHVKPIIAVINACTVLADTEIPRVVAACQKQISGDLAPEYGADAELLFISKGGRPPRGAWQMALLDDADQADALGYHDVTAHGMPLGKVFVKTTMTAGGLWSVTLAHELLEALVDPSINKVATRDLRSGMRLYAYEVGDGVEADELGYQIDGVTVTDFVTADWFNPYITHTKPTSFKGHVRGAFELAAGGYIGYFDVSGGSGWQQEVKDARARHYARAQIGSRRERRRIAREHWQTSTAHAETLQEG